MPAKPKLSTVPPSAVPAISAKHPKFKDFLPLWEQIRDCIAGEAAVKAAKTKYLPRPNAEDSSPENTKRYEGYIARAVFHNVTGRTVENMVGQCFAVDPVYTGPEALQPVIDDIDGAGVSATQQSKKALGMVVAYSRAGLLVDYPKTNGPVSIRDAEEGGIRAKVLLFFPWQIINWRTTLQGAKSKLSLVVIKEDYIAEDDGFETKIEEQFRILRLVNNVYSVEIWRPMVEGGGFNLFEQATPADGSGQPMQELPFCFIGAEANDSELEKPLMLDISFLNLGHYRNSADYEESVYMVGQPTPWLAGLTQSWVDDVLKGKIMLGSRSCVPLPEGGTAGLLQANPNTLPKEAMDQKEELMIALGAKLVEKREVKVTATEAGLNEASATSVLAGCVANVSAAYARALAWVASFQNVTIPEPADGMDEGLLFELNREFAVARLSPEEQSSIMGLYTGKLITFEEARDKLKSGGVAYLDDEDAKDQMADEEEAELAQAQQELDAQTAAQERLLAAKGQPPANTPPENQPPAV